MMHQSDGLSEHSDPALGRTLLMTLALGVLVVTCWRSIGATHARRTGSKPNKLPRRLQTWEGEGGRPSDSDDQVPTVHPEPQPHTAGSQRLQH